MTYESVVSKVAEGLGLPNQLVDRTYKSFWKAVREHMKSQPLLEDLSDEEFQRLRPNVNIPSLGKFYVTLDRYHGIKRQYEYRIKSKENKSIKDSSYVED